MLDEDKKEILELLKSVVESVDRRINDTPEQVVTHLLDSINNYLNLIRDTES